MSIKVLTVNDGYIELEALPSFCILRSDIASSNDHFLVCGRRISKYKIYLYAWDIEENFYIFIRGEWIEAQSIDFDFPLLDEDRLKKTDWELA